MAMVEVRFINDMNMQLILILIIITLAIGILCLVDLWNKKCSVIRRILWSPVPFIPLLGPMLYYALFDPPSVQSNEPSIAKGPIEQWKEWLNNRYNPGYFVGGQIHPMNRATGPGVGTLFLVSGIVDLVVTFVMAWSDRDRSTRVMLLFNLIISFILIYAGITRITEGKRKDNE